MNSYWTLTHLASGAQVIEFLTFFEQDASVPEIEAGLTEVLADQVPHLVLIGVVGHASLERNLLLVVGDVVAVVVVEAAFDAVVETRHEGNSVPDDVVIVGRGHADLQRALIVVETFARLDPALGIRSGVSRRRQRQQGKKRLQKKIHV